MIIDHSAYFPCFDWMIRRNIGSVLSTITNGEESKFVFVWVTYDDSHLPSNIHWSFVDECFFLILKSWLWANFLIIFQGQSDCSDSGFKCLRKQYKPLFLKQLKKIWDHSVYKGKYSASNTLLIDDEPHVGLLNPVYGIVSFL